MCKLKRFTTFEYRKAQLRLLDDRILFYDDDNNLISFFSIWKIDDVSSLNETHIIVAFKGISVVINLLKEKNKTKVQESLTEMKNKKKKYFPVIPVVVMDEKGLSNSMDFLNKLYIDTKFSLPKPKIWGRNIPPFYNELVIFRFDTHKRKDNEVKSTTKVYRRKSIQTLLKLDLDDVLSAEGLILKESPKLVNSSQRNVPQNNELSEQISMKHIIKSVSMEDNDNASNDEDTMRDTDLYPSDMNMANVNSSTISKDGPKQMERKTVQPSKFNTGSLKGMELKSTNLRNRTKSLRVTSTVGGKTEVKDSLLKKNSKK